MGGRLRTLREPAGTLMEVGLGTGAYAEILWIIPNPIEPASLDAAMERYPRL